MGNEPKKQRSRKRSEAWAKEELAGIKPADPRQVRRLHQVLTMQRSSPGASIPQAGERWAEVKSAYRLADSEAFTAQDLLGLTHAARVNPQAPANDWLTDSEQPALQGFVQRTRPDPSQPMNLQTVVGWIGQLCGHLGRKSDGPPGPLALWRGLLRLQDLTTAWLLFSGLSLPNSCG